MTITHEEFMQRVREMAKTNIVISTLLIHSGEPDSWPKHLQDDLYKRLGMRKEKCYTLVEAATEPKGEQHGHE